MGRTEARMKRVYLSVGLSYPGSAVQQRVLLQPALNLRALYFNFPDVTKVAAAFVAVMLLLLHQVCRQKLLCLFSEKTNSKIFRDIPRIAGNKIVIWHPQIDCRPLTLPPAKKRKFH